MQPLKRQAWASVANLELVSVLELVSALVWVSELASVWALELALVKHCARMPPASL